MTTIEGYDDSERESCDECGGSIFSWSRRFRLVWLGRSDIFGPFCSERCAKDRQNRQEESLSRSRLRDAAPELLALLKEIIGQIDDWSHEDIIKRAEALIARIETGRIAT